MQISPIAENLTAGVDRLKKIGNRVACLEGDEAADLAGNLVTLADQIRPLWEMMDCLRREPETFLHKIKEEWVALFMALPTSLKKELLSNIALSVLGKLASSTSNAEDVLAAARIISGSGAFEVGGEGQQRNIHLGFISLADGFEKIQSHLLVVVMEALMKLSKAEYVKIIRELRAQGLAPTLDDHISAKKMWKDQSWHDISACSFLGYILEAEEPGYRRSRNFFSMLAQLKDIKADVSVRLRTFRGAKKATGDGDVGRYAWDLHSKSQKSATGPSAEKLQEVTALWSRIKAQNILPLEAKMTVPEVKKMFLEVYNRDEEAIALEMARHVAQMGSSSIAELSEAEVGLKFAMDKYWQVISSECTEEFKTALKAQMAGDQAAQFTLQFQTVLEILKVYDDVTMELEPNRHANVAISELRERMEVAAEAFELASRLIVDETEELRSWSDIWVKHIKVQNTRPNPEFVLKDGPCQGLLDILREVNVGSLVKHFFDSRFELSCKPSRALIATAQKLCGQLPDFLGPTLARAAVMRRINAALEEKTTVGRVLGPCEVTALKAESAVLKGFEDVDGVQKALDDLAEMWNCMYASWYSTATFPDFEALDSEFQEVHNALKEGSHKGYEWLEKSVIGLEVEKKMQRYQHCLLASRPIKAAASAMAQHVLDKKVSAELDQVLKQTNDIIKKSRQMELALASISMASILLEKPRSKEFKTQLSTTVNFVHTYFKCKLSQLPKYVQTLYASETGSTASAADKLSGKAAIAASSCSAASTSAATAAESMSETCSSAEKPSRKKAKLG